MLDEIGNPDENETLHLEDAVENRRQGGLGAMVAETSTNWCSVIEGKRFHVCQGRSQEFQLDQPLSEPFDVENQQYLSVAGELNLYSYAEIHWAPVGLDYPSENILQAFAESKGILLKPTAAQRHGKFVELSPHPYSLRWSGWRRVAQRR